jgi:hypothetical protein
VGVAVGRGVGDGGIGVSVGDGNTLRVLCVGGAVPVGSALTVPGLGINASNPPITSNKPPSRINHAETRRKSIIFRN